MACTALNRACTGSVPENPDLLNISDVVYTEDSSYLYISYSLPYSDGEKVIFVLFGDGVLLHELVSDTDVTFALDSAGNYTVVYRTEYGGEASSWHIDKITYNQGVYNTDKLLLETGDVLLLESGDKFLLEEV